MKKIINKHMIILFALVVSLLLMTTMYAAINSVTGDIQGKVIAEKQTGVYITDVQYVSDVDADLGASTIKNFKGTFMQNTVKFSNTNSASEIKYKVTVYNNSDKSYPFLAVLYDEEFYDNLNIIFEISSEGYKIGDIINPHETRDIFITFKYKDGQIPSNTTLNANLNFKIANPNRMVLAQDVPETGNYLGSAVVKNKIETIRFELGKIEPQGTISSFDASEKQDGSIMGYYTDANSDGLYDLTFASNEPIYANVNASYLFQNLTNLKEISFNNFNTSKVADMEKIFSYCTSLTSLDVSAFDTSKVTNMRHMFDNCTALKNLNVSKFNTSEVRNMEWMFSECICLTSLDVSNFNTSKVELMRGMFCGCHNIINLDVSKFDTSQVTNMESMFGWCMSLIRLDISNFNTSKVTNMRNMFANCINLTELNVSNFNTSQVTNMWDMFLKCSGLTNLDIRGFDTSQVTNMQGMFYECSGLTKLDISNFNTSNVINMTLMFANCSNLTTIYVSEFNPTTNIGWTTSAVNAFTEMFAYSTKLVGGNGTKYDANHIGKEYARLDRTGTPGYLTNIKDEYPPVAGTMTMKLDNANGAEYVNNTITDRNVYIAVNNGYDTAGGSGHRSTTYTVLKDGKTYLANQTGANILTEIGTYTITVTTTDNAGNVATREGYVVKKIEAGKSPSQLFDQAGTNPDGLHIGDFVNYDAGTWTQQEISEIKTGAKSSLVTANGSTALPTQSYQFGGFTAGSSRNGNASPFDTTTSNYVKDKGTGQAITGWRVFDVEGDTITLISAGNPEDYYHKYWSNNAYISEYILTGNVNSRWSNGVTNAENYQKRDWSKYIDTMQKAQSATPLTKSKLDSWYTKYTNTANANISNNTTFQKIYQNPYIKYQNVIENNSFYWFSTASTSSEVGFVTFVSRKVQQGADYGLGIRLLINLSPDLKLTPQKIGTKTLTGGNMTKYGGDQTYNVWGIK